MLTIRERVAATPNAERLSVDEIKACAWVVEDALELMEQGSLTSEESCAFVLSKSHKTGLVAKKAFRTIGECVSFLTGVMSACQKLGYR